MNEKYDFRKVKPTARAEYYIEGKLDGKYFLTEAFWNGSEFTKHGEPLDMSRYHIELWWSDWFTRMDTECILGRKDDDGKKK